MRYDLNDVYSHLSEMKQAIGELKIVKKSGKFTYIGKKFFFIYSSILDFCQTEGYPHI